MYVGSATPPIPSERSISAPNFRVLLYFFLHLFTQNDQIRLGNTYGKGRVLEGQPRHCVARVCQRAATDTDRIIYMKTEKSLLILYDICWRVCV